MLRRLSLCLVLVACKGSDSLPRPDAYVPPTVTPDAAEESLPPKVDANPAVVYPVTVASWPGDATVTFASGKNFFGANVSGLVYVPASPAAGATLWAIQNEPSKIHRLTWSGTVFTRVADGGWITGKSLRYPGGTGSPDSEGLTRTAWDGAEMYVVAERDNENKDVPRQSILRYDLSSTKGVLDATHEWNLTGDIPAVIETNNGIEGIAWIPDAFLVERRFIDDSTQAPYNPATYPEHGAGLFFVGVDDTAMIYAYALNHADSTFTRVTSFPSLQTRSTDLVFDRDLGVLWSLCDNKCDGKMAVFEVETDPSSSRTGHFVLRATVAPPKGVKDLNLEGFAMAPDAECVGGRKPFFWSDDKETGGYALRRATIPCGRFF